MRTTYTLQLYTLLATEPQAFDVTPATTTYGDLRARVAQLYGEGEDTDAFFARCFFCVAELTPRRKVASTGENRAYKHGALIEAQLALNHAPSAQQLLAPHIPKNRLLLVFPSPAHLLRATQRPPLESARASRFSVEIYAPHRHRELRKAYEAKRDEETRYTRRPDGSLEPRRYIDRLKLPGRAEPDPYLDVQFIALDSEGAMVGYCETAYILYPYGRTKLVERAKQSFMQGVPVGHLFEVAGLSALPSQGGTQIALVLLYHAFHYAWQHRALLPCSHVCSHAASIVTKTYLTRQFGFSYYGGNYFDNDDYPDTLSPQLAIQVRDRLRTCCMHMRDALLHCANGDPAQHTDACIRLYQLTLWFRFVNSKALEMLLVLEANAPLPYTRRLIAAHLALQREPQRLAGWLRDTQFYHSKLGLRPVQYEPLRAHEHETKVPAPFGLDEVLRVLKYARDMECETKLSALVTQHFAELQQTVLDDARLPANYVSQDQQLRTIAQLEDDEGRRRLLIEAAKRIDRYETEQLSLFKELYVADYLDTHLPFARLGANIERVAALYTRGETKNFIAPLQAPQPAQQPPTVLFPDDMLLLRVLIEQQGARISQSQEFSDSDDEYYQNLTLRHNFLAQQLQDYVRKARSDQ